MSYKSVHGEEKKKETQNEKHFSFYTAFNRILNVLTEMWCVVTVKEKAKPFFIRLYIENTLEYTYSIIICWEWCSWEWRIA